MTMEETGTVILTGYFTGMTDALSLHRTLIFYIQSPIIRMCTVKCGLLNGLIFLGSIFFFHYGVMPVIHFFGEFLHQQIQNTPQTHISQENVHHTIDHIIYVLYQCLWMYPIYLLSFVLNTIWYQEIADAAYGMQHGKVKRAAVSRILRDEVYRTVVVWCFFFQIYFSCMIPYLGGIIAFISMSWIYAMYCFEYKWSLHGWSIEKRIEHLESHWTYFAGFGTPFSLATLFAPNFVSKGVFALIFPIFLLLAICSDPKTAVQPPRLPIFRGAKWCALHLLKCIGHLTGFHKSQDKRRF